MTTGEFSNVILSDMELRKLEARYGALAIGIYIEKLSCWRKDQPRKARGSSDYSRLLTWLRKDRTMEAATPKPQPLIEEAELNHRALILSRLPENRHRSLDDCKMAIRSLDGSRGGL